MCRHVYSSLTLHLLHKPELLREYIYYYSADDIIICHIITEDFFFNKWDIKLSILMKWQIGARIGDLGLNIDEYVIFDI